jgi:hypothetical protein
MIVLSGEKDKSVILSRVLFAFPRMTVGSQLFADKSLIGELGFYLNDAQIGPVHLQGNPLLPAKGMLQ